MEAVPMTWVKMSSSIESGCSAMPMATFIAAGDIAAGDIAAGDIAAGDIAAGDIAAGDIAGLASLPMRDAKTRMQVDPSASFIAASARG